jgi:hypothetical protein
MIGRVAMHKDIKDDVRGESKMGAVMVELILGIILTVIGLAMATPLNSQVTNITTGANATAQGAAAVSMWGLIPLLLGVLLIMIPLGQVFMVFRHKN